MTGRQRWMGLLSGLGASAIWGGMYVVSDVVLEIIPPFTLLSIRLLIAIPVLALIQWRVGWPQLAVGQRLRLMGVGVVGFGMSVGAQFVGTRLSTAANGALVTSATPVFVVIFAWLILRERLTGLRVLALLLATAGVVVVINPVNLDFTSDTVVGNIVLFVAGLTWALYSVLAARAASSQTTLTVVMWAMVGGLLVDLLVVPFERPSIPAGTLTLALIAGLLYLGVVSTALAMVLWTAAFERLGAGLAGLTFFAQPVVGAVLGVLLLNEHLNTGFFIGGLLILTGVALVSLLERNDPGPARSQSEPETS